MDNLPVSDISFLTKDENKTPDSEGEKEPILTEVQRMCLAHFSSLREILDNL
jgi:hypothetical protein